MEKMKIKQAFTLIELLVVIAIIGILSGLIVVSMNGITQKAAIAKSQAFSSSLKNALAMNLVSEWKFDDASGTSTVDSWNGGNNGTLTNFANTTAEYGDSNSSGWMSSDNCLSGTCLKFDGVDDHVDLGSNSNLKPVAFTATAWIKSSDAGSNALLTWNIAGSPPALGPWSGNRLIIYMGGNNLRNFSSANVADNNWHFVTFVVPGNGQTDISNSKAYVDGKELTVESTITTGTQSSKGNFYINGDPNGSWQYAGLVDGVSIYNAVIPTSQIKEQYFSGLNSLLSHGNISMEEYNQRVQLFSLND